MLLQPGHKWNNILFHNHTGLKMYPNYMMGGGYVLSGDVVTTLININRRMKLIFTPIEDATLGFWLMAMDLRHIDHAKRAPGSLHMHCSAGASGKTAHACSRVTHKHGATRGMAGWLYRYLHSHGLPTKCSRLHVYMQG